MTIFRMKILARSQRTGSKVYGISVTARRNAAESGSAIYARAFFSRYRTFFLPIFPTTNSRTISRFLSSRRTPTIDRKRVTLNLKVHTRTPVHARVHVFFPRSRATLSPSNVCPYNPQPPRTDYVSHTRVTPTCCTASLTSSPGHGNLPPSCLLLP